MKDYKQIMAEAGIEIPEDKAEEVNKAILENYRTKPDYERVTAARDAFQSSLNDTQAELEKLKGVNVEELNGKITDLTNKLQQEQDGRKADAARFERENAVDTFLAGKKFVNEITRKAVRAEILKRMEANDGKDKSAIFAEIVNGADGKPDPSIVVNQDDDDKEKRRTKFTAPGQKSAQKTGREKLSAMSLDERMRLKRENPELYATLKNS